MRRLSLAAMSPLIALTLLLSPTAAAAPAKEPPSPAQQHIITALPVRHRAPHPPRPRPLTRAERIKKSVDHELAVDAARFHLTPAQLRNAWQRVAICEEGGSWTLVGPIYSGIGFANGTWAHFGGTVYAPLAGYATKDEQIIVGTRVTRTWIPDQYGCSPTGW